MDVEMVDDIKDDDFDPESGTATSLFDDVGANEVVVDNVEEDEPEEREAGDEMEVAVREAANLPENFIEWEAVRQWRSSRA